ncbi:rhodanese-like domain-containing protein [Limnobacter sp.]|uniref:rhodanese-like domain-containing protein n=1 Tax=Limnobacter sp. TaxID=2003368 RepID=UPI003516E562
MASGIVQLSATELAQWLAKPSNEAPVLLDVREPWEFEHARIEGSLHLPMAQVPSCIEQLPTHRAVVCICHHGVRSQQVALFLRSKGFEELYNLRGGIDAWSRDVDPACPLY